MSIDLNRQGFKEVGAVQLRPMINCPPLPGGVGIARVGASFAVVLPGETRKAKDGDPLRTRLEVRPLDAHRGRKCVAICLGGRATVGGLPTDVPCKVAHVECDSNAASAEKALESLIYAHEEAQLARQGEQHVVVLLCTEALDPEGHKAAVREHESKLAAIKATEPVYDPKTNAITKPADYLSRAALLATFGGTLPAAPEVELVGLLSSQEWTDNAAPAEPRG